MGSSSSGSLQSGNRGDGPYLTKRLAEKLRGGSQTLSGIGGDRTELKRPLKYSAALGHRKISFLR